jgi:hypothetical protein
MERRRRKISYDENGDTRGHGDQIRPGVACPPPHTHAEATEIATLNFRGGEAGSRSSAIAGPMHTRASTPVKPVAAPVKPPVVAGSSAGMGQW